MREVLIIGSGIAGMACAIRCAELGLHVTLVSPFPSERSQSVMAAGGIYDRRSFNAALALGAEGVYCGTAFLMSEESRMAANVKSAVLKANAKDLLIFRTIPAYYRSLPGALANKLVEMDKAGATNEELGKTMGGFANLRKGMLEGDMENGYVSVGHAISFIHEVKTVAQIIADMTQDWRAGQ